MPLSDKAKAHKSEYQSQKFTTLCATVSREVGDSFKQYCAERGLSVRSALISYIESCIAQNK